MTILEAMRAGTPVVTTDSLGMANELTRWNAAMITDGSPQSLADAVEQVLSSDRLANQLRTNAHRYLRDQLSIEALAMDLQDIYCEARDKH